MIKKFLLISVFCLFAAGLLAHISYAKASVSQKRGNNNHVKLAADTVPPPPEIMDVVKKAVYSLDNFDIDAVANIYTPNAEISDDEPPYSWNGPTAGVQWVNVVEKACKDLRLNKLKGAIQIINIYHQSADNAYIVVPVYYTGLLPGKNKFISKGAFTFVLRLINDKWLIKSQVWMPEKGIK